MYILLVWTKHKNKYSRQIYKYLMKSQYSPDIGEPLKEF